MEEINAKDFDAATASGNIVVDFWGTGCGNCKLIEPSLLSLETENPNVKFLKINADNADELVKRFNLSALPTVLFIKDGDVKETLVGLKPKGVLARTIANVF